MWKTTEVKAENKKQDLSLNPAVKAPERLCHTLLTVCLFSKGIRAFHGCILLLSGPRLRKSCGKLFTEYIS